MYRLILAFIAVTLLAQAPAAPDPFAPANAFAAAYNDWGHRYEQRIATVGQQGFDAAERRAFDRMCDRFSDMRKYVKLQYQ